MMHLTPTRRRFSLALAGLPAALLGCQTPATAPPPQITLPDPTVQGGLVVRVQGLLWRGRQVAGVRGVVENTTGRSYRAVSLSFDVLTREGVKVADAIANTAGLGPEQKWAFEALILAATPRDFSAIGAARILAY
jgi:hypothetical protein